MPNAHGKICYVEIPATNIQESADFYAKVFGWQIKKRGDGSTAFDDPTGGVSGTWVLGRPLAMPPQDAAGADADIDVRRRDRGRCAHGV